MSTAAAGISIFVYARLSKAVEGARNYLENTIKIEEWSRTIAFSDDKTLKITQEINQIACVQLKIDQKVVDKVTNYKRSMLTSLVGTLAMAGGGITILASAPALATAGTTAVVVGGVLNSLAVMYAAYNCGMHSNDDKVGKKAFNEVKSLIPNLIKSLESYDVQSRRDPPPSYDESQAYQAISNQRTAGIYPDLSGFEFPTPSAPPYEEAVK